MGSKEDVQRALEYGKDPYYKAIQAQPSYQTELAKVRTNYNERTWIDFSGFLPKFTTEEFEKRRTDYQAKYGNTINVPGFSDIVHIVPKAQISAEERAAHLWAKERGLPSPLTPAQLESLAYKKFRFLKALSSATPEWLRTYGTVATVLDNVEDALITVVVLGRVAAKVAPRLMARLVPGLGWLLLGSDILNAVNLVSWISSSAMGAKRRMEALAEKNPLHAKAAARRTLKLNRAIPTFGETLEVLQTTDQLFGVGLCLGGLMGLVTDSVSKVLSKDYWAELANVIRFGTVSEVAAFASEAAVGDYNTIKRELQNQYSSFRDEAYRLKNVDQQLRVDVQQFIQKKADETWGWVKSTPEKASSWFSGTVIGSMIMSTGKDDFLKEDHTKAFMMLNSGIQGLMPWWIENDPLTNFKDLRTFKFRAPAPTDPTTVDMLNKHDPQWKNTIKWPHLDKEYATIEEIAFAYAPMIKDSYQTYCLNYQHDYEAMIAAQQVVDFTKNVIRSFSDDGEVKVGMTAWWAVAEDMMREIYLMPPDTPQASIDALADYIGNHERLTGGSPDIKDVARAGESIGIEWMRTFPKRAFDSAAEIFPEWQAIQDQLDELYVAD
jgi:hypothetical protein